VKSPFACSDCVHNPRATHREIDKGRSQRLRAEYEQGFFGDDFDVVDFVAVRAQTINKNQQTTEDRM
jgi:hypothetical protein